MIAVLQPDRCAKYTSDDTKASSSSEQHGELIGHHRFLADIKYQYETHHP